MDLACLSRWSRHQICLLCLFQILGILAQGRVIEYLLRIDLTPRAWKMGLLIIALL